MPERCAVSRAPASAAPHERPPRVHGASAGEPVGERSAAEVLHHQVQVPVVVPPGVIDRDDVRVPGKAAQSQALAFEAGHGVATETGVADHLDRHASTEPLVVGAIDGSEAAAADLDELAQPVDVWLHGSPFGSRRVWSWSPAPGISVTSFHRAPRARCHGASAQPENDVDERPESRTACPAPTGKRPCVSHLRFRPLPRRSTWLRGGGRPRMKGQVRGPWLPDHAVQERRAGLHRNRRTVCQDVLVAVIR